MSGDPIVVEIVAPGGQTVRRIEIDAAWPGGQRLIPADEIGKGFTVFVSKGELPEFFIGHN